MKLIFNWLVQLRDRKRLEVIRLRWEKARLEQLIREKKQADTAGGSSQ